MLQVYQGAAADTSSSSSSSSSGADSGDAGLIGWVLEPIFTLMKEKSFNTNGYYEGSVTMSFFEVYDEVSCALNCTIAYAYTYRNVQTSGYC
jgi:hypothetical protein